ncbi:DUF916 domain-containing protein [Ruminococcaceae bacterium OttesenSCG-928-A11]|nr:DUF916 domain-containing protein [Ruminococcaceae bacterium OttesenSCG-928-A11]
MLKKLFSAGGALLALFGLLLALLPGLTVQAAAAGGTGNIGFYVRAVLPENQLDKNLTYFDLRMRPGQRQTLEVEVVNETDSAITVDIGAISASTNRNGVIDYKTPDIRDITLENPFSQLATVESGALEIPAQASVTARITIEMPAQAYDGVVLGGLVFTRRDQAPQQSGGTTLQNLYSYVIGVKLSENDTVVTPDFELERVQGEAVNYQAALVHYIRNRNAAIAKGIDLHVVLRNADGQVVGEAMHTGIDMAPNSTMPLAVTPVAPGGEDGRPGRNADGAELLPGDYTSEVTLEHDGQSWAFEQKFTIGTVEAQAVNGQTLGPAAKQGGQLPSGVVLLILLGAAVVVIIGLFVIILLMLRRREEARELNRLMRRRREQIRAQQRHRDPLV